VFFKNKKKKYQQDLNQKVSKYQKWWQDGTGELSFSGSNFKTKKDSLRSPLRGGKEKKALDDSFVYYEMD